MMSDAGYSQDAKNENPRGAINQSDISEAFAEKNKFGGAKSTDKGDNIRETSDGSGKMVSSHLTYGEVLVAQALCQSARFFVDDVEGTPLAKAVAVLIDRAYPKKELARLIDARRDNSGITYKGYKDWLDSLLAELVKEPLDLTVNWHDAACVRYAKGVFKGSDDSIKDFSREMQLKFRGEQTVEIWRKSFIEYIGVLCYVESIPISIDVESATDAFVRALQNIRVKDGLVKSKYVDLMYFVFAKIWIDSRAWSENKYDSISAVAQVFQQGRGEDRKKVVALYAMALRGLFSVSGGNKPLSSPEWVWEKARICCNNASNELSSIFQFDGGIPGDPSDGQIRQAKIINRLQTISVVGNMVEAKSEEGDTKGLDQIWQRFDIDPMRWEGVENLGEAPQSQVMSTMSTCIQSMLNVVSGWVILDAGLFEKAAIALNPEQKSSSQTSAVRLGEGGVLIISTLGACLRARSSLAKQEDFDEPVSALFNSGLAMARLRRQSDKNNLLLQACELACYALGLRFAVENSQLNVAIDLYRYHGTACLVNLLGTWERISSLPNHKGTEALKSLLTAVESLEANDPMASRIPDLRRVFSATRDFRKAKAPASNAEGSDKSDVRAALMKAAGDCVQYSISVLKEKGHVGDNADLNKDHLVTGNFVDLATVFLSAATQVVLGATTPNTERLVKAVDAALQRLHEIYEGARDGYLTQLVFADTPASGEAAGEGLPKQTFLHRSLVNDVSEDASQWRELFDGFATPEVEGKWGHYLEEGKKSYTDFFSAPGALGWMRDAEFKDQGSDRTD
ncbi:hypothetical protein [Vitreoscilla filiformis]|nr:hypothetical protein [Vitreoscilla filiformis]